MVDANRGSVGVDRSWKTTRSLVRERDDYECQHCEAGEAEDNRLEVHHIHAVADGGTDDLSNLVLLCNSCHYKIHYNGPRDGRYPVELAAEQGIDENDYQNPHFELNGSQLATLKALCDQREANLDEIAAETDYARQTIASSLHTLRIAGYVERVGRGKYRYIGGLEDEHD